MHAQMPVLSHAEHQSDLMICNARRWGDAIYAEDPSNDRYYMFINEVFDYTIFYLFSIFYFLFFFPFSIEISKISISKYLLST